MKPTRNQCSEALLAVLVTATNFKTVSRKFIDWDQLSAAQRPSLCLWEGGETIGYANEVGQTVLMRNNAIIALDPTQEPTKTPIGELDDLIDKIDSVLKPSTGIDQAQGRQTLGGLVYHCRIQGEIIKASGDGGSNISVLIVPINVMIAQNTLA